MNTPWVEVFSIEKSQAYGEEFAEEYPWHAVFACQVVVRPFETLLRLKWGFNPGVMYDEAMDRQRLFLESQYAVNTQMRREHPERRTLALRCINVPGKGLQVGLIAKICAKSPSDARRAAAIYWREIHSLFPYDHELYPAIRQEDYHRLAGTQLLLHGNQPHTIRQIKRYETPLLSTPNQVPVLGIWQTGPHADEQIWRTLAGLPFAAMLNISLRPTLLYDSERKHLLQLKQKLDRMDTEQAGPISHVIHKGWVVPFLNRRLLPWGKFYYLQIHILTEEEPVDDSLTRAIGTSLTRPSGDKISPGFETESPPDDAETREWKSALHQMEIFPSNSEYNIPRLHEIADLEEAATVFRLPYPPEYGLPGVTLLNPTNDE